MTLQTSQLIRHTWQAVQWIEPKALTQICVHRVSKPIVNNLLVNPLHFHRAVTRLILGDLQLPQEINSNQEGIVLLYFCSYVQCAFEKKLQINKLLC